MTYINSLILKQNEFEKQKYQIQLTIQNKSSSIQNNSDKLIKLQNDFKTFKEISIMVRSQILDIKGKNSHSLINNSK